VTLKLSWPAIFATMLILFVRAIESFEVPALLACGGHRGVHLVDLRAIHQYPAQIGLASSYAGDVAVHHHHRRVFPVAAVDQGSKYSTMTGKGFVPRTIDLGPWRYLAAAAFFVYFLLIVILPSWCAMVVVPEVLRVPSMAALPKHDARPYRFIFQLPDPDQFGLERGASVGLGRHRDHLVTSVIAGSS